MTTIQSRSSRGSSLKRGIMRRCGITTLLCVAGCVTALACDGINQTATPVGATTANSSARGGVSQLSVMKAEG